MAFVRKKRVGPHAYYYLVESCRTEGKKTPRQHTLMYLGKNPTVEDAVADWSSRAEEKRRLAQEYRRIARKYRRKAGEEGPDGMVKAMSILAFGCAHEADSLDRQVIYLREMSRSKLFQRLLR